MKQKTTNSDEKFENIDFDLFVALNAIDKKDYGYYDRLSEEQKKKFVPFMLIHWVSNVKASSEVQGYYLLSTEYHANKYLFNEVIQKNPKLQWLMLCASSPGLGKQFHQWIPQISNKVSKLNDLAKQKDINDYYKKIYSKASQEDINLLSKQFVEEQHTKVYFAKKFTDLKQSDIEVLSKIVSKEEIEQYERDSGNQ